MFPFIFRFFIITIRIRIFSMSSQSGFLNCFLKFIQGEKGERLQSMGRAKPASARFTIAMDERKAILTASSKRLNQDKKTPDAKPGKQKRGQGRPRLHVIKSTSQPSQSMGSTSESESGGNAESDSKLEDKERLCAKDDANKEDKCVSGGQEPEKACSGDEGGTSGQAESSDGSMGESGKMLRDGRKTSGVNNEPPKKQMSLSNVDDEAGTPTIGSSVILNYEGNNTEEGGKEADLSSIGSSAVKKKKRGRKRKSGTNEDGMPLRKLSSRKAKQKVRISYAESGDEEDIPGLDDNSDSDDPVWVPNEKKGSSDEGSNFSWLKYEKLHLKARKSCSNSSIISSLNPREKVEEKGGKQNSIGRTVQQNSGCSTHIGGDVKDEKKDILSKITPVTPTAGTNGHLKGNENARNIVATSNSCKVEPVERNDLFNPSLTVMPFQSGTFIAQKSDLEEKEEPAIWRVDGKSLLQKYEPFRSGNGNIWYRNVSTYSGWGPKSNLKYQEVPVRFIKQNRVETVVEIIQAELTINEDKLSEKLVKESEKHAYAYEVFVQTLVSHALDSNFLPEIIAEKDEYFLNCVEEMDNVCEQKKKKLMEACQWPKKLIESLITWPVMTLNQIDPPSPGVCSVCYIHPEVTHIKMDGNPYKFFTLEYAPPSDESFKSKEFSACTNCTEILMLFHKIVHLKYHTYERGLRMVLEKKAMESYKSNTDILHDILADGPQVKKEFHEISLMWAQADLKSRKLKAVEDRKINPNN